MNIKIATILPPAIVILFAFTEFFLIKPFHGFSYYVLKVPAFESYVIVSYLVALVISCYRAFISKHETFRNIYLISIVSILLVFTARTLNASYLIVFPLEHDLIKGGSLFELIEVQIICFAAIVGYLSIELYRSLKSVREFQLVVVTILLSSLIFGIPSN